MKFLLDENIPGRLRAYLTKLGHNTEHISLLSPGLDNQDRNWQGQELHKLINDSKLIVIDGNHDWILNHPDLFWKNIEE